MSEHGRLMSEHGHRMSGAARRAVVVVASTSAASGSAADATGPVIARWLAEHGWTVEAPVVVADGPPVTAALRKAIAEDAAVVITTGGTGLSPDDATPEATRAVLDRELPGIAEELRRRGAASTPLALLSRGIAGVAGTTLIVNLPGSSGGVRDGLAVLGDVLDHAVAVIRGSADHGRRDWTVSDS
ncbi:MogA/MoaB family molybdenum cofactor biosynthesis protein [Humibacter sp.]|jgi:molybdenum cofactor synthesis domain-containing protein|uniref:MogA/MoaB family molybdenum cofactor biosynthesis protein n=1 Tax=Humibacter sp. TaxID=1940291 RepID=UPI002C6EE5C6|nr:MogA/MoaB family molybdenum cofactor biosynthesis protein [Humibacter sp.]HVX07574.1 MogA/MoaB family molybdenum cofactor biosynthesis protein [Humibacter sp.]